MIFFFVEAPNWLGARARARARADVLCCRQHNAGTHEAGPLLHPHLNFSGKIEPKWINVCLKHSVMYTYIYKPPQFWCDKKFSLYKPGNWLWKLVAHHVIFFDHHVWVHFILFVLLLAWFLSPQLGVKVQSWPPTITYAPAAPKWVWHLSHWQHLVRYTVAMQPVSTDLALIEYRSML
jgi:hypothetical protein